MGVFTKMTLSEIFISELLGVVFYYAVVDFSYQK